MNLWDLSRALQYAGYVAAALFELAAFCRQQSAGT